MKNLDIKLSERQKDLVSFLKDYFKDNKFITPNILSNELGINLVTAYEHLRNLKEKGILGIKFSKEEGKGRPKYLYYLTNGGKKFLSKNENISEIEKFINEFNKAKEEGQLDLFISEKLTIITKKTIKPLLFTVLGFLILVTFFSNIKELETLKEFLFLSSSSGVLFISFTSYLFYLLSKYVNIFKPYNNQWEDIKYNLISLNKKEREEIVRMLIGYINGGELNEC
ncbi:MAG TPA: hypothetical protein P5272_03055 [Caldisericia bacterium]|nr:hypothetical protein [Caldisericia bacterium]HOL82679.1 hypothetical protein [Caldisericia bacterium]HON83352.1 hypothetical protein [Caldisericia bacterium]HPC56576.1 hypothetical protein [Caldisericia bacterium]HPP43350.1 hypothetical protein [Caldisericia bacterium]